MSLSDELIPTQTMTSHQRKEPNYSEFEKAMLFLDEYNAQELAWRRQFEASPRYQSELSKKSNTNHPIVTNNTNHIQSTMPGMNLRSGEELPTPSNKKTSSAKAAAAAKKPAPSIIMDKSAGVIGNVPTSNNLSQPTSNQNNALKATDIFSKDDTTRVMDSGASATYLAAAAASVAKPNDANVSPADKMKSPPESMDINVHSNKDTSGDNNGITSLTGDSKTNTTSGGMRADDDELFATITNDDGLDDEYANEFTMEDFDDLEDDDEVVKAVKLEARMSFARAAQALKAKKLASPKAASAAVSHDAKISRPIIDGNHDTTPVSAGKNLMNETIMYAASMHPIVKSFDIPNDFHCYEEETVVGPSKIVTSNSKDTSKKDQDANVCGM